MLFTLSNIDIAKIRRDLYPQSNDFSMKGAAIKTSGTDTIFEISIDVKDYVFPTDIYNPNNLSVSKIYKNKKVKNTLKFKVFQIVSQAMSNELQNIQEIAIIDNIIKKYGALSYDIFPCIEYKGATVGLNNEGRENNEVILNYRLKYTSSEKDVKYLSFGMIFYFDIDDFVQLKNISPKYIIKEVLSSDLKIINLLDSSGNSINEIVQDIRTINKTFKSAEILDQINESIFFNSKTTKLLSETQKTIPNNQFFSKIYTSRDTLGNLNLLFNMDYRKIVQSYSNFSKIMANTPFPADIEQKCKIASLKVVRRQMFYDAENIKKPYIKNIPLEVIASTSQKTEKNQYGLQQIDTVASLIRESEVFNDLRTIEVVDKTAYNYRTTGFQYGVEMTVSDGYYQYLYSIRDSLKDSIQVFKEYLSETEKYINPRTGIGNYDPETQSFTKKFANETFPKQYEERLNTSLSILLNSMKAFGFLNPNTKSRITTVQQANTNSTAQASNQQAYEDQILTSLVSLMRPEFSNENTILLLIHIYEKFVNQINRLIKDVSNTTFNIKYWFEDKIVDASQSPAIGYGFFDIKKTFLGLTRVTNLDLEKKIAKDIYEYNRENNLDNEREKTKYSSVGPEFIKSKNTNITLKDIREISNDTFMDLELEIKRHLTLGDEEKDAFLNDSINSSTQKTQTTNSKTESSVNKFSSIFSNLYKLQSDAYKTLQNGAEVGQQLDQNVNPRMLYLAMLKNTSKKPTMWSSRRSSTNLKFQKTLLADAPTQIYALLSGQDSLFSEKNIDYLKDLNNNSKFLLLFNTIHNIEILLPSNNVKNDNWQKLSTQIYNSLTRNGKYLCRLKLYKNDLFNIKYFDTVELPIYDEYFILDLNNSAKEIDDFRTQINKTYSFAVDQIKARIASFNSAQRAAAAAAEAERLRLEEQQRLAEELARQARNARSNAIPVRPAQTSAASAAAAAAAFEVERLRLEEQQRLAQEQITRAAIAARSGSGYVRPTPTKQSPSNNQQSGQIPLSGSMSGSLSGSISGSSARQGSSPPTPGKVASPNRRYSAK